MAVAKNSGISVGLDYFNIRIRRTVSAIDAVGQSSDAYNRGKRWVVAIQLQHAIEMRRFSKHSRLKIVVTSLPKEHVKKGQLLVSLLFSHELDYQKNIANDMRHIILHLLIDHDKYIVNTT